MRPLAGQLRWSLAALGCAAAIAGCNAPPPPRLAATPAQSPAGPAAVGCWELHPVGWRPHHLPERTRVRLDTLAGPSEGGPLRFQLTVLAPIDSADPRRFRLSGWAPVVGRDSLLLILGNGFGGVDLRLGLRGDRVAGQGYHFTDFPAVRSGGRVSGARISCEPAPEPSADRDPAA